VAYATSVLPYKVTIVC